MGKELSLACSEEEGRSMLLAITSSGEHITTASIGNKRAQISSVIRGLKVGKVKDTETKSKGSSETEGANASSPKKDRRGRCNKNRKSDRRDEGENKLSGRSAQQLGVTHPGSYCDELETVSHYWIEKEKVARGSLFQCKFCHDYIWLPINWGDVERLTALIKQYGRDEGYCRFLNYHRVAKMLMAKLQDLGRLEKEVGDKIEFARVADKILSDKEYDRG